MKKIKPQPWHLELTHWKWLASYPENLILGDDPPPDIGALVYLQCKFGVTIESGCMLGSHCSIYSEDTIGGHSGPVVLEEGCRIGTHSTLLPNVKIGKNIIIPAYSLIKRSILTPEDLDAFLMKNGKRPFNFGGLL